MSLFDKFLSKMKTIKHMKKIQLLWEERGDILVLTALLLPIMFGCLGIAYDLGNIYIHKARLQNVTDAAALAGGRAYLQSQLKTGESVHKDTYDSYTNGNVTDEEYVIGGSKTRSGYHPDADKAADDYIYKNIVNLGDVEYAILETSGQITVIEKPNKRPTIPEDFDIMPEYEGIPYDLVIDGKIMYKNLEALGKDYTWLKKEVNKFNFNPEEALVVTIDGKGQIFCHKKES